MEDVSGIQPPSSGFHPLSSPLTLSHSLSCSPLLSTSLGSLLPALALSNMTKVTRKCCIPPGGLLSCWAWAQPWGSAVLSFSGLPCPSPAHSGLSLSGDCALGRQDRAISVAAVSLSQLQAQGRCSSSISMEEGDGQSPEVVLSMEPSLEFPCLTAHNPLWSWGRYPRLVSPMSEAGISRQGHPSDLLYTTSCWVQMPMLLDHPAKSFPGLAQAPFRSPESGLLGVEG